jgi:hypothetical protein
VITAIKPEQPDPISTTLINLNIRISWAHPSNNYQDIEKYEIEIKDQTEGWHTNTDYCNGDLFT